MVGGPIFERLRPNPVTQQRKAKASLEASVIQKLGEKRESSCQRERKRAIFMWEYMKNISYASTIGSLMYAQVCTGPDIAYVVGVLGRYQSNPGVDHWKAAKKVMRYRQGTKDYMIIYRRTECLEVISYSDLDYVGCVDSQKSTTGYIFMLADEVVSWRSVKQTLIATSTMNFVSYFEATYPMMPLKLYCDNSATVFMAKNNSKWMSK
ncbi:secreted RxLR effector protein 161-like [Vigna angularis]|uniref:secreted RxLR effector protein 161-like n=1 Tax=Phaseolus angularis TaxID=3914 RepID=UPI0022B42016|nr:secreted RxLR effector protein 161-like [Vigna angularis]